MKSVEILGASGVGKTTLFKELYCLRQKYDHWLIPEEAQAIIMQNNIENKGLKYRLASMVLRINFSNYLNKVVTNAFLKKHESDLLNGCIYKYEPYLNLLIRYMLNESSMDNVEKSMFIKFYFSNLIKKVAFLDLFKPPFSVVYHDGIVHNNPGFMLEGKELQIEVDKMKLNKILPSGAIYIRSDPELCFYRKLERRKQGQETFLEFNASDKKLYRICEWSLKCAEKQKQSLERVDVKVVEIDAHAPLEKSTEIATEFIRSIDNGVGS